MSGMRGTLRRAGASAVAALVVAGVWITFGMGVAAGADCPNSVEVFPDPTWLEGPISVSGSGWAPDTDVFVNLGGEKLFTDKTDAEGNFSKLTNVPEGVGPGSVLLFVQDGPANCEVQQQVEILDVRPSTTTSIVSPPSTFPGSTTSSSSTSTTSTTINETTSTSSGDTATSIADTTTIAGESTTTSTGDELTTTSTGDESTTTSTGDDSTTAIAESGGGDGVPAWAAVLSAAILGAGLGIGGLIVFRRSRGAER